MNLYGKLRAALAAALIAIASLSAFADAAPYDMSAPQNLAAEHLYAESALLVDQDTGEVLFSKNAKVRMYPASTTKIMTLLLGIESGISLDEPVTVPAEAGDIPDGSSVIPVKPGDVLSYRDLLYSFMLSSGNDGANAVAVLVDGSIDAFVRRMNARAAELGLEGTHYVNAHGYHDAEHYTTAQDLATLSRAAMENDVFRDVVAQPVWTITVTRGGETKSAEIISRNSLLQSGQKYYYPDCTGIKTGHHNKAGWCFVGSAERDGMRVICVVLNCAGEFDKWYDAARLFEYGFTRYGDVTAGALLDRVRARWDRVQLEDADPADPQGGQLALELAPGDGWDATEKVVSGSESALDAAAQRLADGMTIEWLRPLTAPVEAGELMGRLTCAFNGATLTAELTAARSVAAKPAVTEAPTAPPEAAAPVAPAPTMPPEPASPRQGIGVGAALILAAALLALCCAVAVAIRASRRRKAAHRRARRRRRGNPALAHSVRKTRK